MDTTNNDTIPEAVAPRKNKDPNAKPNEFFGGCQNTNIEGNVNITQTHNSPSAGLTERVATAFCALLVAIFAIFAFWPRSNTDIGTPVGINSRGISSNSTGIALLDANVAPNAILNGGGRPDETRCHPGTRKEVMGLIEKWRTDNEQDAKPKTMFWLKGPAGAGKTAIVQSIAESWKSQRTPVATFFFYKTDPTRSHADSLVSTLLSQMFEFYPTLRAAVEQILISKPHIMRAGIAEQFDELMLAAFDSIMPTTPDRKLVILVDGLDECTSDVQGNAPQRQIITALHNLSGRGDLSFLVLISSREEQAISAAFSQFSTVLNELLLDDQYAPQNDIRIFLQAKFEGIKNHHPYKATLDSTWPPPQDLDTIVEKSCGRFIYPATVMRFLENSPKPPRSNLIDILELRSKPGTAPFVHLDALYIYLLESAHDHESVGEILSAQLIDDFTNRITQSQLGGTCSVTREITGAGKPLPCIGSVVEKREHRQPPLQQFLQRYDEKFTDAMFHVSISEITALAKLEDSRLVFYHASLSEFLLSSSRSGVFYADLATFGAKYFAKVWEDVVREGDPETLQGLFYAVTKFSNDTNSAATIAESLLRVTPESIEHYRDVADDRYFLPRLFAFMFTIEMDPILRKKIVKIWIQWAVSRFGGMETYRICYGDRYAFDASHMPLLRFHIIILSVSNLFGF